MCRPRLLGAILFLLPGVRWCDATTLYGDSSAEHKVGETLVRRERTAGDRRQQQPATRPASPAHPGATGRRSDAAVLKQQKQQRMSVSGDNIEVDAGVSGLNAASETAPEEDAVGAVVGTGGGSSDPVLGEAKEAFVEASTRASDGGKADGKEEQKRRGEDEAEIVKHGKDGGLADGHSDDGGSGEKTESLHEQQHNEDPTPTAATATTTVPIIEKKLAINAKTEEQRQGMEETLNSLVHGLNILCQTPDCKHVLNKLEHDIVKNENKLQHDLAPLLTTTPPPAAPDNVRESPDWTEDFSSTSHGSYGESPASNLPINKVRCFDKDCGVLQVHYLEKSLDSTDHGQWTTWFTEKPGLDGAHCPMGTVVSQLQCKGLLCGELRLRCQKPNTTVWQIDESATEEKGWFNNLYEATGGCSPGYALYGMRCTGENCHSKQLLCKGSQPAARDCLFGPWSEWSECAGLCDAGLQTRYRKVEYDPHWGSRCHGPTEHKRSCTSRICVEGGH